MRKTTVVQQDVMNNTRNILAPLCVCFFLFQTCLLRGKKFFFFFLFFFVCVNYFSWGAGHRYHVCVLYRLLLPCNIDPSLLPPVSKAKKKKKETFFSSSFFRYQRINCPFPVLLMYNRRGTNFSLSLSLCLYFEASVNWNAAILLYTAAIWNRSPSISPFFPPFGWV